MRRFGSRGALALVLMLAAGRAFAQTGKCGVDFYGPCLPETPATPSTLTLTRTAPAADAMARNSFDEAWLSGDDGLVKAVAFSVTTGKGGGAIKTASAESVAPVSN